MNRYFFITFQGIFELAFSHMMLIKLDLFAFLCKKQNESGRNNHRKLNSTIVKLKLNIYYILLNFNVIIKNVFQDSFPVLKIRSTYVM